jgi:beta-lactamase class A
LAALASGAASCLSACSALRFGGNGVLQELERAAHGHLGVAALDSRAEGTVLYRADERFPMCSTAKLMIVGAILRQDMDSDGSLSRRIEYGEKDLVPYSPVTEKQVAHGMVVAQLCAAALQYSDNTAANLLLRLLGGPQAVTAFARSIGDETFRLDRWEPELNSALPGDERDTTSPMAMAHSLRKLLLGDALTPTRRAQLHAWMRGNTTGDKRIRAGVPPGWDVADKTGTGAYGTCNDVGILWPPYRVPIMLAVYFTCPDPERATNDAIIAEVTRHIAQMFG